MRMHFDRDGISTVFCESICPCRTKAPVPKIRCATAKNIIPRVWRSLNGRKSHLHWPHRGKQVPFSANPLVESHKSVFHIITQKESKKTSQINFYEVFCKNRLSHFISQPQSVHWSGKPSSVQKRSTQSSRHSSARPENVLPFLHLYLLYAGHANTSRLSIA